VVHDPSHGYDDAADAFIRMRSETGAALIRKWAAGLPKGASVLDVGAGHGWPVTAALLSCGLDVFAVEASPRMVRALEARLPKDRMACEDALVSPFFSRRFDGITAIGLVFLLEPEAQEKLLIRLAKALTPGGQLLFTAPWQSHRWTDVITGQPSVSLGADAYQRILRAGGLSGIARLEDEGGNCHFQATRPSA
jgi:cyclopropane fatty-acyl-phospholipid synthase-like methyltransferase